VITWLTDADVHPDRIAIPFPKPPERRASEAAGRGGCRRVSRPHRVLPQRAGDPVRGDRGAAAGSRIERGSVLDVDEHRPMEPMDKPMTTLYLTGHSLGGAMAALMAVMLSVEEEYVELFAPVFKGAYTFGAPMVGSPKFAAACAAQHWGGTLAMSLFISEDGRNPSASSTFNGLIEWEPGESE